MKQGLFANCYSTIHDGLRIRTHIRSFVVLKKVYSFASCWHYWGNHEQILRAEIFIFTFKDEYTQSCKIMENCLITCFKLRRPQDLVVSFRWLRESWRLIGSLRNVTEGTPPAIGGCLVLWERRPLKFFSEFLPRSFRLSRFLQEFD